MEKPRISGRRKKVLISRVSTISDILKLQESEYREDLHSCN